MATKRRKYTGIFWIVNEKHKMFYVGESKDLNNIISSAYSKLDKGKHPNKLMQRHWLEGPEDFSEWLDKEVKEKENIKTKWLEKISELELKGYINYKGKKLVVVKEQKLVETPSILDGLQADQIVCMEKIIKRLKEGNINLYEMEALMQISRNNNEILDNEEI